MTESIWYFFCLALVVCMLLVTSLATRRVEAFQTQLQLIYFCAGVWILAIAAHIYVANEFDFEYDGVVHLSEASVVAEDISSGGFSFEPRSFLGNKGYQLYLALLVEFGRAPKIVPQVINGILGFLSVLLIFESACVATNATYLPRWILLVGFIAPSALLWFPLNLKEAIVCYGIGSLVRFTAYVSNGWAIWSRLRDAPGVFGFLLLRPHICFVWVLSLTIGSLLKGKSLSRAIVLLLFLAPTTLGSLYVISIFSPALVSQAEELGTAETLDSFREDRSSIGQTAVGGQSRHPLVSGMIITLFSSIEAISANTVWIVFTIEACLITFPLLFYSVSPKRLLSIHRQPLFYGLVVVIVCMAVFLGYMYNIGLAVRQRLQVTPALLMLLAMFSLDSGEENE